MIYVADSVYHDSRLRALIALLGGQRKHGPFKVYAYGDTLRLDRIKPWESAYLHGQKTVGPYRLWEDE